MRIKNFLKCCILILATYNGAIAQSIERLNSFSYSVNEGLLQSTIGDIAYDKNNFCWISFPNGIQKFDGREFTMVPIQPGLPDDKFVKFFRCSNGDLLISHSQGISKYEINSNRFILVYSLAGIKKAAQFIGEDGQVIFLYTVDGNITGINLQGFTLSSNTKTGLPDYSFNTDFRPTLSSNIIHHKTVILIKDILYCWDLKKKQLIAQSESIKAPSPFLLRMRSENEVLYYNYLTNNALHLYNFSTKTGSTIIIKGKDDQSIGRCNIIPWQNKTLISFNERVYEFDTAKFSLGPELVNFQNESIGEKGTIARLVEDNFGNLCLGTVTTGIRKIIRNNYPVRYYGTLKKDDNNNILSILPDKKNNRILVGTSGNGLLVFDTLQRLIKHTRTIPGDSLPKHFNCIIKDNKGNYLLFCNSDNRVWSLKADLSGFKVFPATSLSGSSIKIDYFGNRLYQDEKMAITQSQGRLYRTSFTDNTCTAYEFTTSYTMGGLYYKGTIISHANDELIFLDTARFKELKRMPFKNTGYVRCFVKDAKGNIYMGCNKGIFKIDIDGRILKHLTKTNGLPDECIYAMAFDENGSLWCSSNKGIFKLNSDNSFLQLTKDDGLQENEFNTNVVAQSEDGEMFFGGVNGVSSFYPAAISRFEEKINLFFTKIRINNEEAFKDTAVWNIEKINLPYHQNSLAFDFIAMANNNPGQYIYQYRMEGIDKGWILNNDLQTVRYFLPPGEYVFKIYAGRFFDKDAKPMKEIHITINPPFWKTWWFITGMILLAIAILAYSFNRYNKNKYQKKLDVLENEHRIQLERERISRDLHDSIGAYANAVLYNTELLQKENDINEKNALMNDLKFASKDIITSLRETVWALKKDHYTEEECLLRIKNFIQALARYYPHIQFKAAGEASAEKILHHTKALHVVRIVQEAVTNAVKHAVADSISLSSNRHNGKWELTVVDDGKGFDYEKTMLVEQGNGLLNMSQRATESGIDFTVTSMPGSGTKVTMLI
ncbi:MAG: hypothetical protein IPL54_17435 [Chitinophagaceae bacterium]|nr:hypothetical protein [Chitinophagaceae bacterium]